jgi:protease IV
MNKSGCFGVALFLALCLSMLANLVLFGLWSGTQATANLRPGAATGPISFEEELLVDGTGPKVAVIPLEGMIAFSVTGSSGVSMVEELKSALDQANNDPDVVGIVLSVDSPGGEITASDVLYQAVRQVAENKPVVVFMNSIGASGAYYTACGASWIMCNPTTFTGSIGVIISTLNYEDLFGKVGLASIVFKSGKFKDMLSGSRPITPEESAYVQELVMQSYDRFLGIVATARKQDPQRLYDGPADGRILSGEDALKEGLVDQVGYIEESYDKAAELAGVEDVQVVRYRPSFNFSNFFSLFAESRGRDVQVNLLPEATRLEPGRVYLLPPSFAR